MNKVRQIIEEEFDSRLSLAVITYLLDNVGMTAAANITDDDISSVEESKYISKAFIQGIMRAARRIAQECDFIDDILPYMISHGWRFKGTF